MRNDDLPRQEDPRDPCLVQPNRKDAGESDRFAKNGYNRRNGRIYYDQKEFARQMSRQDRARTLQTLCSQMDLQQGRREVPNFPLRRLFGK